MYQIYNKIKDALKQHVLKILLIMRVMAVILLLTIVNATASIRAQSLTLSRNNVPIIEVFLDIRKQTDYDFLYAKKTLENAKPVTINIKNGTINEVLDQCFDDQPFTYSIQNKVITVKKKQSSLLDKINNIFSVITVKGVVVDQDNFPLAGATVKIKGSTITTRTNNNGEFLLNDVNEGSTLVISYLGFDPKEVAAVANLGTIKLVIVSAGLKEIEINAGYYTVKDRERTGSISKITAEQIGRQPVNNVLMALQGLTPGLQITQQTGLAGGGFTVQIRGQNSLRSGNDPLYIVDGVTYPSSRISGAGSISNILGNNGASPLSMINPNDIESFEILKDADATAIYGSRGANGVILITTKKGREGNTKVNASIIQSISQVGHRAGLLNTQEYIQMRKEAYRNDGLQPGTTDYDVNGIWDQNKYTNWQEELIGGNAKTSNASLNISGGAAKSNYLIAGNYYNEGTVFPGDFGYQRASIRSGLNLGTPEDRFSSSFTLNYNYSKSNLFATNASSYILLAPNAPDPYDQYGQLNWSNGTFNFNPMALFLQTSDASTNNLIGNLSLNYRIWKNLILKASLGYSTIRRDEFQKYPLVAYPSEGGYTSANRVSYFANNYTNNLLAEPILTYQTKIGPGNIDALIGLSLQANNAELRTIKGADYTSDDLMDNIGSAGVVTSNYNTFSQYRYFAVFARMNYSIANNYFINLTARRDGSSRFGPDNRFANFGAIGAGWIFTEENFVKDHLSFLNFGKLRVSYGITGNDQITDYGYLQLWNTGPTYQGNSTLTPGTSAPNANFAWETNRKLEIALQVGFLKNRLNLEVSFYRNRSSNQLLSQTLPLSTGLTGLTVNLPADVQNTGWEFDSSYQILNSGNWKWSGGLNLTIPKNKLLAYPGLETSSNAITYQVGESLSILKVYNTYVDKQTGQYVIEDKNGNGTTDNGDRYLTKFIGQAFYGGLQNSVKFKQFSLDFQFSFTKQTGQSYRTLTSQTPGRAIFITSNQYTEVLERWQQPGDETEVQKFSTIPANSALNSNVKSYGNLSIVDASYIRLRNISLAWSLPKNWLSALKVGQALIILQGQNVFTMTDYIGLDPETQNLNLPPLRTIAIGLNVTF